MRSILLRIFAFPFCFVSVTAFSQSVLRGTLTDSLANEPLIGANVVLIGTSLGAPTDMEGHYRISNIPDGSYSVRFSYVGYRTELRDVTFDGTEITISITLAPEVIEGQEVVVMGQARGQIAAINQQISSTTVVNVVSRERIQELPDVNAAEVIGRLPGVALQRSGGEANKIVLRGLSDKFSAITVDGIRVAATDMNSRGVDLSTIAQGSLAGIELFKAVTPDKDADAIAGSVNMVTRKAPAERMIQIDVKGIYNQMNERFGQYDMSLQYGERFLDGILGVQAMVNLEKRDRSAERTNLDYGQSATDADDFEITNFSLQYVKETRKRGGGSLLLDYATPDDGSIRLNTIYNSTNRNLVTFSRNYPTGSGDLIYGARDQEIDIATFNTSIRGDNHLLGLDVTWGVSFAQSHSENPYDYYLDFLEPPITGESKMRPIPSTFTKGPVDSIIPFAYNNFDKAFANNAYFQDQNSLDRERSLFFDIAHSYSLSGIVSGQAKFGAKYRHKARFKELSQLASAYYLYGYRQYERLPDGTVRQKDFTGTRFENVILDNVAIVARNFTGYNPISRNIYDRYALNPIMIRDALREWYRLNKYGAANSNGSDPEYVNDSEVQADFYDITERVPAAYVMNTLNVGESMTLIAGLRMEREDNDYASRFSPDKLSGFPTPVGRILDTTSSYAETVWLPNLHLTVRPFDFLNVRVAAYRALARPDFDQRLEYFVARDANSVTSVEVGNARLKAAKAWNYEVNTSFFGSEFGLVSLSAFYKEVKDMFHLVNGVNIDSQRILDSLGIKWKSPFAEGQRFQFTFPYNSTRPTRVWGFELEHQAKLGFISSYLGNLTISYNLSMFRSETYVTSSEIETFFKTVPGIPFPVQDSRFILVERKQKLETQPEFFGNVSVGYDVYGLSARVSVFFQGEYNQSFSGNGRSDQIRSGYTRWDCVLKQKFTDNISVFLNVNNLTNIEDASSLRNRTGPKFFWTIPDQSERYDLTGDLGVRFIL